MKIKNLALTKCLYFYCLAVNAESFEFGIDQISGSSSYEVEAKSLDLKSRLMFPYNLNSFNVTLSDDFLNGNVKIGASIPIANRKEIASDFDWKQDQLTVFSTSISHLDEYFNIHAEWTKKIINRVDFATKIYYRELDTLWSNSRQYDYVKNIETFFTENTLSFKQNYLIYDAGLNYLVWSSKSIKFILEARYVTGLVKFKDTHILRDFYTLQRSKVSGYNFGLKFEYDLGAFGSIFFGVRKKQLSDKHAIMDYFTTNGFKFASYSSNYHDISNSYYITFKKYF